MKTQVNNRSYPAKPKEEGEAAREYKVKLKKEVFSKFFSVLKLAGQGLVKVNNQESIELEYTIERCPHLSLVLETGAMAH